MGSMINRNSFFSAFRWSYAEQLLSQVISLIISIVLARLIEPGAFGTLAIVNSFIAIANAMTLTGFGSALIQKEDASDTDFSSVVYFSLLIAVTAYGIIWCLSPGIAAFFADPLITDVLRVFSFILITASFNTVQRAYIARRMQFKLFFIAGLGAAVVSGGLGIFFAYQGYGVWALIVEYLSRSVFNIIILWILSGWRPRALFSIESIKGIYRFGSRIIISSLADAVYQQLRSFAIGKKYTAADLAYYDRGRQFPSILITNIDTTLANVLMPALSRIQDDKIRVKYIIRRAIRTSSVILFPLLVGMAACAEDFVTLLLTDKWLPCVPYMQVLCMSLMMKPMITSGLQGILAIGQSRAYMWLQLTQKAVGIIVLLGTILFFKSPFYIAIGEIAAYLLFLFVSAIPYKRCLNYTIYEQLSDIVPQFILAIIMGAAVHYIRIFGFGSVQTLFLQIVTGGIFYICAAFILKMDSFIYILDFSLTFIRKKR